MKDLPLPLKQKMHFRRVSCLWRTCLRQPQFVMIPKKLHRANIY